MIDRCNKKTHASRGRSGLTLTEIFVCTGIVGLVTALILPAIQSAREGARRVQCASNLRQIGVALHAHEAARGAFPRGGHWGWCRRETCTIISHAPHLRLLPYLQQEPLYEMVDLGTVAYPWIVGVPGYDQVNLPVQTTTIATYLCPSDPITEGRNSYRANIGVKAFPWDYKPFEGVAEGQGLGAFAPANRDLRPQHFPDGLSQTIAFSERLRGDGDLDRYDPARDAFTASDALSEDDAVSIGLERDARYVERCASLSQTDPPHDSSLGGYWFFGGLGDTWYNHLLTPNHPIPDCGQFFGSGLFGRGVVTARSAHSGGVTSLFVDGHVQFVADAIDLRIWQDLGTRDGNWHVRTEF